MLRLYNTLTRSKDPFLPLAPPAVNMYVCGMTVYDYCHLGHARVMVVFDMVQRWLRASGYRVTYVRNITDIDDKIIRRAVENGESIGQLTERYIRFMDEDAAALGVHKPDFEPRATRYIEDMQAMIAALLGKGLAYESASGDVNFSVRRFPGYGKLSGKSLEDLRAGERVEVEAGKQDPLDFVLWKRAKEGEPFWTSPWGNGRPGWHIECSAMGTRLLGAHFDIHGGGQDLQFPHHENEIAQSEGANGGTFVNYWMHNGFVRVDDEKMSKSLGNFFTIRDILKRYDPEVVRFFILRAHYRSPLNYGDSHLDDARASLGRLYGALENAPLDARVDWEEAHARRFRDAMDDDFSTPEAVAVLFDLAAECHRAAGRKERHRLALQLRGLGALLGLLQRDSVSYFQASASADDVLGEREIESMIAARAAAKRGRNYAEADRIRKALAEAGVMLEDTATGTRWKRA